MKLSPRFIGICIAFALLFTFIAPGVAAEEGSQPITVAAALTGFEVISVSTANDNITPKSVTASCPPGKVVIGGGVRIFGNVDGAALTTSAPNDNLSPTQWIAGAADSGTTNLNWGLRVDAHCINAGVISYQVVKNSTASSNIGSKTVTATCPAGHAVIGGGAEISGLITNEGLVATAPAGSPQPNQWTATAQEIDPLNAGPWALHAYAFCATTPQFGLVTASLSSDTTPTKSLSLDCKPGGTLVGGGALMTGTSSNYALSDISRETPTQWRVSAQKVLQGLSTQNWGLTAYAFCFYQTYLPIVIK
jgi:hypothetical protein